MKTIFGFFSCALAGATAQSIAVAANSDQAVVLNLRFFMRTVFSWWWGHATLLMNSGVVRSYTSVIGENQLRRPCSDCTYLAPIAETERAPLQLEHRPASA